MLGLFFIHKKSRDKKQTKLEQYYNEQVAYRESLKSLYNARNILMAKDDVSSLLRTHISVSILQTILYYTNRVSLTGVQFFKQTQDDVHQSLLDIPPRNEQYKDNWSDDDGASEGPSSIQKVG